MPFCANCGWSYAGNARFCRECGRPLYRSPTAGLRIIAPGERPALTVDRRLLAIVFGVALAAGAAQLVTGLAASATAVGSFPLDEAWVRLVYARALAQNARLEFNSGLPDPGVGSLLWVGLMAFLIKTIGSAGVSVVALAKGCSLLAGAAAAALVAELTRRITASRLAALAVGLLAALDAEYAFAAASGMEATLLAALVLAALVALFAGRPLLIGAFLALAILTRLEAILLALLFAVAALWPHARALALRRELPSLGSWSPRRRTAGRAPDDELAAPSGEVLDDDADIAGLSTATPAPGDPADDAFAHAADTSARGVYAPPDDRVARRHAVDRAAAWLLPLLALLAWYLTHGLDPRWLLPRLAESSQPGPLSLVSLWTGYVDPWVGLLGAGAFVVALPVLIIGARAVLRQEGVRALPLVAFAPLVAATVALALPPESTPWPFERRHHLAPLLPLLPVLFVLGVRATWVDARRQLDRRIPRESPWRPAGAVAVVGVALAASCGPVAAALGLWSHGPAAYASATRAVADTYFAIGRHTRDELPETALIAALEPGAIRYVSRHPVADLRGEHTPTIAARSPVDGLAEARAEYAALPLSPTFESLPGATLLRAFPGPSEEGAVGLFRLTIGATAQPRENVYAFPSDALRRLDYLDVTNEPSERAHAYQAAESLAGVRRASRLSMGAAVDDDGRQFQGSETFEMNAEPGRDLILARRYDATSPGVYRLTVDGQPAGEWWPRGGRYLLAEETVRIPGGLIRRPRVSIQLQLQPGQRRPPASFGYWSFVDR